MMSRNLILGHLCLDGQAFPVRLLHSFVDYPLLRKEKSVA